MPSSLRAILIIVSVITMILIGKRIKKSKLRLFDGFIWLFISVIFTLISIFPNIIFFFSKLLKIQSPVHLVFLLVIFWLFIVLFYAFMRISNLESQVTKLAQEVAIRDERFNNIETSDDSLQKSYKLKQKNKETSK